MTKRSNRPQIIAATPAEIALWLEDRRTKVDSLIEQLTKRIDKAPAGRVRTTPHGTGFQYYHILDPKNQHGKYLCKNEYKLRNALLQKAYDKKILQYAVKEKTLLNQFLSGLDPLAYEKIYTGLGIDKAPYIIPVAVDEKEYVCSWEAVEYSRPEIPDNIGPFLSLKGERMRSKSEVIIADNLYLMGVPYRYEQPLVINGRTVHPDFTVLNVRKRKEIIWEHLGLMDEIGYRNDAFSKMNDYEESGFFLGENLIVTAETGRNQLNVREVRRKIEHYCL